MKRKGNKIKEEKKGKTEENKVKINRKDEYSFMVLRKKESRTKKRKRKNNKKKRKENEEKREG